MSFKIIGEISGLHEAGVRIPLDMNRPPISALPQDERINLYFGQAPDLLNHPQPVTISITYENAKGDRTEREVVLDVRQFEGFSSAGARPEDDIAESLKKIEQHLGDWSRGFRKLHVMSGAPQVWRDEDERKERLWREQESKVI